MATFGHARKVAHFNTELTNRPRVIEVSGCVRHAEVVNEPLDELFTNKMASDAAMLCPASVHALAREAAPGKMR